MNKLEKIEYICLLLTLKNIKEDIVFKNFISFLDSLYHSLKTNEILSSYSNFVSVLNETTEKDLAKYLIKILYQNKHEYSTDEQFEKELDILCIISTITIEDIKEEIIKRIGNVEEIIKYLPKFQNTTINRDCLNNAINSINMNCLVNRAFLFDSKLNIVPVGNFEKITFNSLKGYKRQKEVIYNNTKQFLEGKKVNNILLYGDTGCGKSSTVKALLNEFKDLKMIQVYKDNLIYLDELFKKLENKNDKYIIFADDITFEDTNFEFSKIKGILEGSLVQCPKNVLIYATSNRRHLVKENFQSRIGDEVHLRDTLNEYGSLSERFGINIFFGIPNLEEYLEIVLELAKDNNINLDKEILIKKAKQEAMKKAQRSPRVAKQVIDNILAGIDDQN